MLRAFVGALGIVTGLFPDRILDVFETVAIENPDEATTKSWIVSGMQTEASSSFGYCCEGVGLGEIDLLRGLNPFDIRPLMSLSLSSGGLYLIWPLNK